MNLSIANCGKFVVPNSISKCWVIMLDKHHPLSKLMQSKNLLELSVGQLSNQQQIFHSRPCMDN